MTNNFHTGDRVTIVDGPFAGMEGQVRMDGGFKATLDAKGLILVTVKVFDRDVPVELEYWQIEHA